MKRMNSILAISGLMLIGFAVHADVAQGKKLAQQSCTQCHDTSVYTRPDRQVRSLDGLQHRVNQCERPASVSWSKKQTADVVEYLNKTFYHFK